MTIKSKTKIEKQLGKKRNRELIETIILAKKNSKWNEVASLLSGPSRKKIFINLEDINEEAKAGEILIVPGKVLSMGEINKKIKIAALNFSEKAREKLIKAGCEIISLEQEIERNKDAKGVKILK